MAPRIPLKKATGELWASCSTNELPSSEQDIATAAGGFSSSVQGFSNCILPTLSSRRITVHDLLRTKLHNFLKTYSYNLGILLGGFQFGG